MRRLIIIFILILSGWVVRAQNTVEAGIQFSGVSYFGDVEDYDYLESVSPGVGIFGRWNLNRRMALRGQLMYGRVKADGVFSNAYVAQYGSGTGVFPRDESQSFSFSRSLGLFEALYEYNFNDYIPGSKKGRFSPYVAFGGGICFSPASEGTFILEQDPEILGDPSYYRPYEDEPGKRTDQSDVFSPVIPFGMGIKWNISDNLALNIEALLRKTFTDNIDNLSDPKRFKDFGAAGDSGSGQSYYNDSFANSTIHNNDWFSTVSVSFSYLIWNGKCKCPVLE